MAITSHTHDDAAIQLEAALVEQDRLESRFRAALGTGSEFGAYARLTGGRRTVGARQAWLAHVDKVDADIETRTETTTPVDQLGSGIGPAEKREVGHAGLFGRLRG